MFTNPGKTVKDKKYFTLRQSHGTILRVWLFLMCSVFLCPLMIPFPSAELLGVGNSLGQQGEGISSRNGKTQEHWVCKENHRFLEGEGRFINCLLKDDTSVIRNSVYVQSAKASLSYKQENVTNFSEMLGEGAVISSYIFICFRVERTTRSVVQTYQLLQGERPIVCSHQDLWS